MVYRIEKTTRTVIYLKKAILIRSGSTKNYPIRNIKCTGKEEKINSLREGMHVRLEGMLVLPEIPRNPGQFNRRSYESGKKIDFYLENPTVLEVKEQRSGVREVVEIWKTEMMNRCEKIYPDAEAGILEAMLFGEKRKLSGDIKELYQAAGISHVLVISGLHISLLALAVAGVLRRLGFPMPVWVILSVGVLAGYGILIGQPTTAVRALLMFFVLQGARLLGRSYDLLSALAFAGILMLLDNPDLILDGGCRLSFCAVIGVGWYVSEKNKIFRSIGEKEKRKNRGKGGKGSNAGAILENIRAGWNGSGSGRMEYIFGQSCGKSGLWNVAAISGNREHIREAAGWYVDSGSTVKTGDCRVLSGDFSAGFSGKTADKKRKTVENISGNGTMQYVTAAFADGTSLAAERKDYISGCGTGRCQPVTERRTDTFA